MPDLVYRFRTIKTLLEFHELERHQIYLAPPQALNDPMEGYKEVVLRGDAVLWENLLRHYVLALTWTMASFLVDDRPFAEPDIPAGLTSDDLPTDEFRAVYEQACDDFLRRSGPASLLRQLVALEHPLRRHGIRLVLSLLNSSAFSAVTSTFQRHGLMPNSSEQVSSSLAALDGEPEAFARVLDDTSPDDLDTLAFAMNYVREQHSLRVLLDLERSGHGPHARRVHYLFFRFPDRYVDGVIEGLVHPPWRTACFTATCTNASNWAAYADNHRGVALAFRPQVEHGRLFIPLTGVTGSNWVKGTAPQPVKGKIKGDLHPVTYSSKPPEIEFFQSLGNLARAKLARAWHSNRAGEQSRLVEHIISETAAWREEYWSAFHHVTTTKLEGLETRRRISHCDSGLTRSYRRPPPCGV